MHVTHKKLYITYIEAVENVDFEDVEISTPSGQNILIIPATPPAKSPTVRWFYKKIMSQKCLTEKQEMQ